MSRDDPWVCPICGKGPCVCLPDGSKFRALRTASDLVWAAVIVVPAFLRHGLALRKQ